MALAIRLDHLIKSGQVTDQAELARVGHVSRARLTQIMDLNLLSPDIQEAVLLMQFTVTSETNVRESDLRAIAATISWTIQLEQWLAFQNLDQAVQLNVGS